MTTKHKSGGSSSNQMMIAGAVIAVIVVAAVVAALVFGGGDSDSATDSGDATTVTDSRIPTGGDIDQTASASVEGSALPRLDRTALVDVGVGMAAPTIVASHFDGTEAVVEFGNGEPAIVLFMAHWCPHCQAEVISLVDWFEANGVPDDVNIVAVSTGIDEGAPNFPPSSWLRREEWPLPVIRDSNGSDLGNGYGLSAYPFLVIVNGDGDVVSRQSGGGSIELWEANLEVARIS